MTFMNKEWFIVVEGKQKGPYSIHDLKNDSRVTPDTLVWKEGFKDWKPMRSVPELKEVFKDEEQGEPLEERFKPKPFPKDLNPDQETLTLSRDPIQFLLWLLLLLLVLIYFIFQLYHYE